jgi:hypothetical protein
MGMHLLVCWISSVGFCCRLCDRTDEVITVDGGAWRTHGGDPGSGFEYPDFLLSDEVVTGVKGGKKSKL